jgi:hypothetical protein
MLILRLGMTETTLLYYYYLEKIIKVSFDMNTINSKKTLVNWLCTTSGFYSKNIQGSYFNFSEILIYKSIVYNKYMNELINIIKNSDNIVLNFHNVSITKYLESFKKYLSSKDYSRINKNEVFEHINNKKLLIVSSFADLIKIQIDNGNCKYIYDNFPNILYVSTFTTPYTFFNKGEHNDIFETAYFINTQISQLDQNYDIALVSCGAYSLLIANFINRILNKDVIVLGGDIQTFFGILNTRTREYYDANNIHYDKQYWITTIPDKYKPVDYMKIENGCYW